MNLGMIRKMLGLLVIFLLLALAGRMGERQAHQHLQKIQPIQPPTQAAAEAPPQVEIEFPPEPATLTQDQFDPDSPGGRLYLAWEANAQQRPSPPVQSLTEPSWVVNGVVLQGDQSQLMLRFSGQEQVHFYRLGDTLPGGSKLLWIEATAIGVLTPQKKTIQIPILEGLALPGEHNVSSAQPHLRVPERQR